MVSWSTAVRKAGVAGATALLGVALLAGCGDSASREVQLADYVARVARSVDAKAPDIEVATHRQLSANHRLAAPQLPTPEDSIGVLDFLSLSGCELQVNLGRRNSQLGRTASPSQRLLLDLEFLRLTPACIDDIRAGDPALALQLETLAEARQRALPQTIYNALLAGPEWRLLWQVPANLGAYPAVTSGDIADTLGQLNRAVANWLGGDYRADGAAFERQLSVLRSGEGGHLLRAAVAQAEALAAADSVLADPALTLCPFDQDTDRSRALRNVATRFFANGLQPWLADLRRREALLMPPIRQLEAQLAPQLPSTYRDWQADREQWLTRLTTAPKHHAQTVSRALAPCGGIKPERQ